MFCYCDYSSGDAPDFPETTRMVTARKAHECCECLEPIKPGETYERVSGRWGGKFRTYKTCAHCAALRQDAHSLSGDYFEGVAFGQLACWYVGYLAAGEEQWEREQQSKGEAR